MSNHLFFIVLLIPMHGLLIMELLLLLLYPLIFFLVLISTCEILLGLIILVLILLSFISHYFLHCVLCDNFLVSILYISSVIFSWSHSSLLFWSFSISFNLYLSEFLLIAKLYHCVFSFRALNIIVVKVPFVGLFLF